MSTKKLAHFFTLFIYVSNKLACLKLSKHILICSFAVLGWILLKLGAWRKVYPNLGENAIS
jgi:hypothetical protein